MPRLLYILFLLIARQAISQILPKENSKLNYRLIGFSLPFTENASGLTIEIADGNYNNENEFNNHIIKTVSCSANKTIIEVPHFDRNYTWRANSTGGTGSVKKSTLFHFSTLRNDEIDSCNTRFRVLTPATKYKDAYVFLDSYRALYDMNGQPVWFLPPIDGKKIVPRDIKLTPFGTITLMLGEDIYEINYSGEILWKGPHTGINRDSSKYYHHQLSRLDNGHYMVMGNEPMWLQMPTANDSSFTLFSTHVINPGPQDSAYRKVFFGTLIEYDKDGQIVWMWRSSNYFNKSDLAYHKTPDNRINTNTHSNAFFFDENNKVIYISFKGISRILKIKYPGGTVLNAYGELYKKGMPEKKNPLFCDQHSCMLSRKGYLYLFNNNLCNMYMPPKIVVMREPLKKNEPLSLVWEYECTIERTWENIATRYQFPSGGNVIELPDQSIFACMAGMYSKIFIVGLDKKVLWSALPEKWDEEQYKWEVFSQYRASIVTDGEQLERLIWNVN